MRKKHPFFLGTYDKSFAKKDQRTGSHPFHRGGTYEDLCTVTDGPGDVRVQRLFNLTYGVKDQV